MCNTELSSRTNHTVSNTQIRARRIRSAFCSSPTVTYVSPVGLPILVAAIATVGSFMRPSELPCSDWVEF